MIFGKLFGGGGKRDERKRGETVEHAGCVITPAPLQQNGTWYVAGTITRSGESGEEKHEFIRADTHADWQQACDHAIQKAQRMIDDQGDTLFRKS